MYNSAALKLPVARAAQEAGVCRPEAPCMITSACGTGIGTLDRIHHALYLNMPRESTLREASPTACIIDSQSVKSAEKGGLASTATASMQRATQDARARSGMFWIDTQRLAAARHPTAADRSGSRRRSRAAGDLVRSVSLSRDNCSPTAPIGARSFTAPWPASVTADARDRDRQAIRSGEGLRRPAQALGGRTAPSPGSTACRRLAKDWENLQTARQRSPSPQARGPFDSRAPKTAVMGAHKVSGAQDVA